MSFAKLKLMSALGILPRRLASVQPAKCGGCIFGAMTKKPWRTKAEPSKVKTVVVTGPGDCVSVDQLESSTPGFVAQLKGILAKRRYTCVDIPPSSQPDRALSALTYGLKPSCNISQSRYGRTPIACAHTTGDSNAHLIQVSYRNLLTAQYKQGCNQGDYSHTQVYQKLNTHQLHLNAPYKHLSASVATSPVERTN
jgi:hypothetical protein